MLLRDGLTGGPQDRGQAPMAGRYSSDPADDYAGEVQYDTFYDQAAGYDYEPAGYSVTETGSTI
jgi:hypothetical protein